MKKQILNLGKTLNKKEQKLIHGGGSYYGHSCGKDSECIDPTIEYSADELEGYGCQNGTCGYA